MTNQAMDFDDFIEEDMEKPDLRDPQQRHEVFALHAYMRLNKIYMDEMGELSLEPHEKAVDPTELSILKEFIQESFAEEELTVSDEEKSKRLSIIREFVRDDFLKAYEMTDEAKTIIEEPIDYDLLQICMVNLLEAMQQFADEYDEEGNHVHHEGCGHDHDHDHHHEHVHHAGCGHAHGETITRLEPKTGRNDPCVCGSGKKYKKCCMD